MAKAFIFDFDGTLVDNYAETTEVLLDLAKKYTPKVYERVKDRDINEFRNYTTRELLKEFKISMFKLVFVIWLLKKKVESKITTFTFYADYLNVLSTLKKEEHRLGILTRNSAKNISNFLAVQPAGLFDFVKADVSVFGKTKAIKKLALTQNIPLDQVYYVGDEVSDIEACKKLGVKIIAVSWGFNSPELLQKYSPDFLIHKPSELLEIAKSE